MISLEAYRAAIGCFSTKLNLTVRNRCYRFFLNEGKRFLPHFLILLRTIKTMRCFLMFTLMLVLLKAGDIESNPGPVNIQKVVQGTVNQ